jgi:hypothetical protein
MPDYKTGKIYIILSETKKLLYIGSTTQAIQQRLANHITDFKYYKLGNRNWRSSFDVLECEDYKIELLEEYPCCNKPQLDRREGEHIKTYSKDGFTCVNKNIAGRTNQEYYTDNREAKAKYRETHKEARAKYDADYYKKNKEDILKYKAEYRETHKEAKAKYDADYQAKNKEKIAKQKAEYYKKNSTIV